MLSAVDELIDKLGHRTRYWPKILDLMHEVEVGVPPRGGTRVKVPTEMGSCTTQRQPSGPP
jgi:hypothetical protein